MLGRQESLILAHIPPPPLPSRKLRRAQSKTPGASSSFLALKESIKPLWVQGGPGLGFSHETGVEQMLGWLAPAL